jgi:excisionase family DNA binding protein
MAIETIHPEPTYLDKKQAANLLQVSERTLNSWMQRGLVSYLRIGRTIRFRKSDLELNTGVFYPRIR